MPETQDPRPETSSAARTLLVVGDSPENTTGIARVLQNLLRRWRGHFARIVIWACDDAGDGALARLERRAAAAVDEFRREPFVIVPGNPGRHVRWWHESNLARLLTLIQRGGFTHVFLMGDHFTFSHSGFPEALRKAARRGPDRAPARVVFYCPVDAPMDPEWAALIPAVDATVCMTEYGRREVTRAALRLPDLAPEARRRLRSEPMPVLPHGVDPKVFFMLGQNRNP